MESIVYNCDCMEAMAKLPDGAFDLAIVDPPYGIGKDWEKRKNNRRRPTNSVYKTTSYTNDAIPPQRYFDELRRVAKERIIWGYNYYAHILGSTNYLLVWDKCCGRNDAVMYSKCEIAYTSFHIPCNIVHVPWDGYRMGAETGSTKIHPHQKPVALYDMVLNIYSKPGMRILDTHVGSGSSRIAAYKAGLDFVGYEIDKDYFEAQEHRFQNALNGGVEVAKNQLKLF